MPTVIRIVRRVLLASRRQRRLGQPLNRLRSPISLLRSQKGVALLVAMFAIMLMTFVAVEVAYDTSVDYIVAVQQVARIRAYYAAKSGIELSLVRIMLYKQVMAGIGDSLGPQKSMLDPIWSFPFMWPPTTMGSDKMTEVDKDILKDAVGESLMQGIQYTTQISPEGGKLDINDLGSDLKSLKTSTIAQVVAIFQSEVKHNEEFGKKYASFRFEELVNNISDYISPGTTSLNGGDKGSPYRDVEEKNMDMPPGRTLRTLDELHQVAKMTDDFYNVLAPRVTVFGTKGININYANKDLLMALDPTMTDEITDKVIGRRSDVKLGGPFTGDQDFFGFIQPYGVNVKNIEDSKIPLLYDMEFNFRIISTGFSGNVKREITAVTYDFANLTTRLGELMDKQDQQDKSQATGQPIPDPNANGTTTGPGGAAGAPKKPKIQAGKGRPSVVYWEEN